MAKQQQEYDHPQAKDELGKLCLAEPIICRKLSARMEAAIRIGPAIRYPGPPPAEPFPAAAGKYQKGEGRPEIAGAFDQLSKRFA